MPIYKHSSIIPNDYVSSSEAALMLRVTAGRIRQLRRAGTLDAQQVGRDFYFSRASINRYIATPARKGGKKNATKVG